VSTLPRAAERMARREAAACFLVSDSMLRAPWSSWDVGSCGDSEPCLEVRVLPCPQCGADDRDSAAYVQTLPFWLEPGDVRVVTRKEHLNGRTSLAVLGCEAVPVRAFLLIAVARRHLGSAPLQLQSRACTWAERGPMSSAGDVEEFLRYLDAGERWADGLICGDPTGQSAIRILPSSTRRNMLQARQKPGPAADLMSHRAHFPAHFVTPHPIAARGLGDDLNARYASVRRQRASEILRAEALARN
jgi:hypothetical protein